MPRRVDAKKKNDPDADEVRVSATSPLIFISHDSRDAALADLFSNLLKETSAGILQTFNSSDRSGLQGIPYGKPWFPAIIANLQAAHAVVCILTRRSIERPWILYEAGVATGQKDKPVFGLALGVPLNEASIGPFGQFQNSGESVEEIAKLVIQLVCYIPGSDPKRSTVEKQVADFRKESAKLLKGLEAKDQFLSDEKKGASDLLEEVKSMYHNLPAQLEKQLGSVLESRLVPNRRTINPIPGELFKQFDQLGNKPITLLAAISPLREEWPWLYELGFEAYQALKINDHKVAEIALNNFLAYFERTLRLTSQNDERYFFLQDLWKLLKDYIPSLWKN